MAPGASNALQLSQKTSFLFCVPDLSKIGSDALRRLIKAEAAAATDEKAENLAELDAAVGYVYNLERDELVVANESVIRARMLIFEGVGQRKFLLSRRSAPL